MVTYLLDTNILNYLEDAESPFHAACLEAFSRHLDETLCISILSILELDYRLAGADPELRPALTKSKLETLETYAIIPLDLVISEKFGMLKARYKVLSGVKAKTMKTHPVDIILAATAIVKGAVLVSNDRIFSQLADIEPALQVENWAVWE